MPETSTMLPASHSDCKTRVLIVDRSADSRDVLRTVLQHRGIEILEAAEAREGLAMARRHQPNLIVLDLESTAADPRQAREDYDLESRAGNAPLVLIGTLPGELNDEDADRLVRKPYHYGPLIRKIEELLGRCHDNAPGGSSSV